MPNELVGSHDYKNWLREIKSAIRQAQIKASLSVNSALIELYWNLGEKIVEKQRHASWGDSIIEKLARDLKWEFPQITGFSRRNLYAIKQWYLFYSKKCNRSQLPITPARIKFTRGPIKFTLAGVIGSCERLQKNLKKCHKLWHKFPGGTTG